MQWNYHVIGNYLTVLMCLLIDKEIGKIHVTHMKFSVLKDISIVRPVYFHVFVFESHSTQLSYWFNCTLTNLLLSSTELEFVTGLFLFVFSWPYSHVMWASRLTTGNPNGYVWGEGALFVLVSRVFWWPGKTDGVLWGHFREPHETGHVWEVNSELPCSHLIQIFVSWVCHLKARRT